MMKEFKNKKALIVGLGQSGLAAAKFLVRQGAKVTITDSKQRSELEEEINTLTSEIHSDCTPAHLHLSTIEYHLGSNPPYLFNDQDLVVMSPGVPLDIEGVRLAREREIPVICEVELGLSQLGGRLIAITGTNGKSTTTALVGEILKKGRGNVWVGGNIGRPLIAGIEEAKDADYVVLELSSYQLEITPSLKPYVAVWLNATPDHLDRYRSFDQYVDAKAVIGLHQDKNDWGVFNYDDQLVTRKIELFKSIKLPFSVSKNLNFGAWYDGHKLRLKTQDSGSRDFDFSVDTSVAKIKGVHNQENIAAAASVAAICGLGREEIEGALKDFGGLPHRLQFVREFGGVSYFNDSKGTNVGAVVRSIDSFESPVFLIAGGQDKNTGYAKLRDVVREKVRWIFAIGQAAEKISDELRSVTQVTVCKSMEEAVGLASKESTAGDVVLLSPACASFDMYKDYVERGEDFVNCVNQLGFRI